MKVIEVRNVQDALVMGITHLIVHGRRESSRNGDVYVAPTPVTTVYDYPRERVLFSKYRDANPFFHLVESAWMLAGRSEVQSLSSIVKRMNDYMEWDGKIHGAYGHRWRNWFGFDQVDTIIDRLRNDPSDRQCVLAMWDAGPAEDLTGVWRDRPCNTHIYFRMRDLVLDMTVCCRSNDIIWGAYGANAVHFSVLQEFVAAHVGVKVGRMYQISNNFHAYVSVLETLLDKVNRCVTCLSDLRYSNQSVTIAPMGAVTDQGIRDIWHAIDNILANDRVDTALNRLPDEVWCRDVVLVFAANHVYKRGGNAFAREILSQVHAPDWRQACIEWLDRRTEK